MNPIPPRTDATRAALPPAKPGAGEAVVPLPRAAARREMGAVGVLVTIFACLLVGHLAIATYFPSVAVNAVGVVAVTLIIGRVLFLKNDVFAALLIVFFCSQFNIANNQGGLFNLVAFLLFAVYLVAKPPIRETGRAGDPTITSLLLVLFFSNLVGLLLRNPMPLPVIGLEAAAFSGFLLAFYFAASLKLTEARLRVFLIVAGVMAVYNFAVSLNQKYAVLMVETPLLGLTKELFYATSNAFGTYGSASANGQYAMLILALMLPLLAASAARSTLKLSPIAFVPVAVMCGLTLILANMRAAVLEAGFVVLIYMVMFSLRHRRHFRNVRYLNAAAAVVIVVLATVGVWFNLENIAKDFQQVEVKGVESIESGEALNRFGPWQFGWERLEKESFIIGYGHGIEESNQIAWGIWQVGDRRLSGGGHLHNLYLALPMMYGWTGAAAYVLLHLAVVFRLWNAVRRHSFSRITTVSCLGFLMSLGFFLIDEVKSGNAVQVINYPMVMWIWLGLGLASWRTLNAEQVLARKQRLARDKAAEGKAAEDDAPEPAPEAGGNDPRRPMWQPARRNRPA